VKPSGSKAVLKASELLLEAIKQALRNTTIYGALDPNATSFSLQLYSLHEADPLFTYHYAAPALAEPTEGVAAPDSNTVYRIGSVSKLLTVYIYLIKAGDASWNDPITKYVPELTEYANATADVLSTDEIDTVGWKEITVGALASQLAGIGRDRALPGAVEKSFLAYGLPPVPAPNASFCGTSIIQEPCDRAGTKLLITPPSPS
jgi:CubicO group peptidase (beta-lactamase class C family)